MLRPCIVAVLGVAAILTTTLVTPAMQAGAVDECVAPAVPVYEEINGQSFLVGCIDDPDASEASESEAGEGSGGASDTRTCTWRGAPISCGTSTWVWYQSKQCYAKVTDPQPEADHPAWDGHEPGDGIVIQCIAPSTAFDFTCDAPDGCGQSVTWMWAPGPPDAGPSAIELARQALVTMGLTMGQIGVTGGDPDGAGWRSVIGLPIWLWVANPWPQTVGPITASASDRGLTVSVTATLDRIEWTLSSPSGVLSTTCSGTNAAGTPYEAAYDDQRSPTCG